MFRRAKSNTRGKQNNLLGWTRAGCEAIGRFQLGAKLGVTVGDPENNPLFEFTLCLVHVLVVDLQRVALSPTKEYIVEL